ncbi:hypothetical protein H6P81_011374 [Aristolochia fimbriata]|uniref:Chlororespiratory reduction 6 n=1 Tax=Aristolochia fimbriata TaxID=158543 RepID=A0AAV7ES33_ARIFI|nr:hypothetical protein H6P81_011374 [Aristolochia fimbriata]
MAAAASFFPVFSCSHRRINSTNSCVSSRPISLSPSPDARVRDMAASVAFNPSGNFNPSLEDLEGDSPKVAQPLPPTVGRFEILINNEVIRDLDLSPVHKIVENISHDDAAAKVKELLQRTVGFAIDYEREDPSDPRELTEFPDLRLWFVRMDACFPWLPVVLDWRAGELARYAAMLVPHQMSMRMGVVFNPEALELFVMKKVFIVYPWLKQHKIPKPRMKTSDMARMLGFGIGDDLYDLIDKHPNVRSCS